MPTFKGASPRGLRMDARQPLVPVGELQSNGNLARTEVAVGTKDLRVNLRREFTKARSIRRIGGAAHPAALPAKQIRQSVGILVEHPGDAGTRRPVRDRLAVAP